MYECDICGVTFDGFGSVQGHIVGSTSGDHKGVGFQSSGPYVTEVKGQSEDIDSTGADTSGDNTNMEQITAAEDTDEPGETNTDGTKAKTPEIPENPDRSKSPVCPECGSGDIKDVPAGVEFEASDGSTYVTDEKEVQCMNCYWVGAL